MFNSESPRSSEESENFKSSSLWVKFGTKTVGSAKSPDRLLH